MKTATAAWTSAAARAATISGTHGQYEPIWVVELLGIDTHYATRRVTFGGRRTFGDGALFGSGVAFGGQMPSYSLDLAEGSIGSPQVTLADSYTGMTQVGGLNVGLLNHEGLLPALGGVTLDNAVLRLRLGFAGLGRSDYLELWRGVIDRYEDLLDTLRLECIDASLQKHRSLDVPLSAQYFPGTPQANRSRNIPLILGVNTDVEAIQVSGAAQGTLGAGISSSATSLLLTEFGAPFPATGTVSIASETGVTYTARALVTSPTDGKTYLQLSGLTRGGGASGWPIGTAVTLTNVAYVYLIGYQVSALQAVRGNGAVISGGSYTLSTAQADAPVSLLTFPSAPAEPVTVDVNAGSLDIENQLTNGGFEDGALTPWTAGAGATAAVGTSSPDPNEGTYRASLEGASGVYKDLYQEFGTIPGEDYFLELSYQDSDSQLLTNGGFESGDLTGWTVDPTSFGGYQIVDATVAQSIPASLFTGAFFTLAADGHYALMAYPLLGTTQYLLKLSQDVTTSIGTTYTLTFRHLSQQVMQFFGGGGSTAPLSIHIGCYVTYAVGTTTGPGSLVSERRAPYAVSITNGNNPGGYGYAASDPIVFVASATTTRITVTLAGFGQPAQSGGGNIPPPLILFDAVRLQNSSAVDTSESSYQVGTLASPGSILDTELPPQYVWTKTTARFRATAGTTRLTLRSRYTTAAARSSYFDTVQVRRVFAIHAGSGGENPVEQLRYLIDTFLPYASYDQASFLAAYDQLKEWRFGTVLYAPGDSKALLQRMAEQCKSLLVETSGGVYKLIVRDNNRETLFGFNRTNMVEDTFRLLPEKLENVYTEVYVYFGAKTGGSTSPSDFAAVTYCTPTSTTHGAGPALTTLCQGALATYKRPRRLTYFADFIQDIGTANLLLAHLVQTRTLRHSLATFESWLDAAPLEIGDVIQVTDPRYPNLDPFDYEIVGMAHKVNDATVHIEALSLRASGWADSFTYAQVLLDGPGWDDSLEA